MSRSTSVHKQLQQPIIKIFEAYKEVRRKDEHAGRECGLDGGSRVRMDGECGVERRCGWLESVDADPDGTGGTREATECCRVVQGARVHIWLFDNTTTRLEGTILVRASGAECANGAGGWQRARIQIGGSRVQGFDEYMNVVLDNAVELDLRRKTRVPLGRLLLRGDNITLVTIPQSTGDEAASSSGGSEAAASSSSH